MDFAAAISWPTVAAAFICRWDADTLRALTGCDTGQQLAAASQATRACVLDVLDFPQWRESLPLGCPAESWEIREWQNGKVRLNQFADGSLWRQAAGVHHLFARAIDLHPWLQATVKKRAHHAFRAEHPDIACLLTTPAELWTLAFRAAFPSPELAVGTRVFLSQADARKRRAYLLRKLLAGKGFPPPLAATLGEVKLTPTLRKQIQEGRVLPLMPPPKRMGRPRVPPQERKIKVALYVKRQVSEQITYLADKYGCSRQRIMRQLIEEGIAGGVNRFKNLTQSTPL